MYIKMLILVLLMRVEVQFPFEEWFVDLQDHQLFVVHETSRQQLSMSPSKIMKHLSLVCVHHSYYIAHRNILFDLVICCYATKGIFFQ